MNTIINKLYKNNATLYKALLFIITTVAIVYLFPKEGKFKYDFSHGKLWSYDNLYAPFDFSIQKSEGEIAQEKQEISQNSKKYFVLNTDVPNQVQQNFNKKIEELTPSDSLSKKTIRLVKKTGNSILSKVYKFGFVDEESNTKINNKKAIVHLRNGNVINDVLYTKLLQSNQILPLLVEEVSNIESSVGRNYLLDVLSEELKPNASFDADFTQKELEQTLQSISYTKGKISKNELIILKGDIVEGKNFNVLKSFEAASKSQVWTKSNYNWIVLGYSILVSLALLMLLLFLSVYRTAIFRNNSQVTFIFFNVFFFILIQTVVEKNNVDYMYIVPLSILPIILKAFFDARLALLTHVLTVLLLGFIVPDSFEFTYLHIIAGIVTTLSVSHIYKRGSLFISIGLITLTYMVTYFACLLYTSPSPRDA